MSGQDYAAERDHDDVQDDAAEYLLDHIDLPKSLSTRVRTFLMFLAIGSSYPRGDRSARYLSALNRDLISSARKPLFMPVGVRVSPASCLSSRRNVRTFARYNTDFISDKYEVSEVFGMSIFV